MIENKFIKIKSANDSEYVNIDLIGYAYKATYGLGENLDSPARSCIAFLDGYAITCDIGIDELYNNFCKLSENVFIKFSEQIVNLKQSKIIYKNNDEVSFWVGKQDIVTINDPKDIEVIEGILKQL